MQTSPSGLLFSATDLVNYLECGHLTALDQIHLTTPLPRSEDSEEALLFQNKGHAHEAAFLDILRTRHGSVVDIRAAKLGIDNAVQATLDAMRGGAPVIYQASLRSGNLIGHADFLYKVPGKSSLGDFHYEVADTKLARSPKAKFLIQLCFYSDLLEKSQGVAPAMTHVVLGDGTELSYRLADYAHYYREALARFLAFASAAGGGTYPDPCERCEICHWRGLCEERRRKDDHLVQVANITKVQIRRLAGSGIGTLERLAKAPATPVPPHMHRDTFARLCAQARLQLARRETGADQLELLPTATGRGLGFDHLPPFDDGDLFFDMEGDPLENGGLEYLFGVAWMEQGNLRYRAFWAHDRAGEKRAFEAFMDFLAARLAAHPRLHIYHYAPYEKTALQRLMCLHGTREAEVDELLRRGTLVDLYRVVRESIRVSEPRYSIKNLEAFYMGPRSGAVKDAGASIVYYERWKESRDPAILEAIRAYNEYDCRSTNQLRQWLAGLRDKAGPALPATPPPVETAPAAPSERLLSIEATLEKYRASLIAPLPSDPLAWTGEHHLGDLTFSLLDFHRRAAKPEWWALFARMEMTEEELIEDVECIAGLELDPSRPPRPDKKSIAYTYRYPEQEFKLKNGDDCTRADTAEKLGKVSIDEPTRTVHIRIGNSRPAPPVRFSIGPGGPLDTDTLRLAIPRFAESLAGNARSYPALEAVLRRETPRIRGLAPGAAIIEEGKPLLPQAIDAIARLEQSTIFIQGPPGAGKTYAGSRIIAELLRRGKKIAVSANSHKVIHNLLDAVIEAAKAAGTGFRGVKKATARNADTEFDGDMFTNMYLNRDIDTAEFDLVAGTAWLFADPRFDQAFDYLFLDEAGQVALANLVATGTCAKNIVLLGDQMQLGQPIQGAHPGRSGESALEYLLDGRATIAAGQGIFLKTSWRMHPDVCRFISAAVYDGRLEPEPRNASRHLVLGKAAHPALRETGVRFVPVAHEGCSQRSEEEATLVAELVHSLLAQSFTDENGNTRPMTLANILVVAPYNMQVNLLRERLPDGARIGTVDKFQGQEAEAVIVSMATSSEEYLPRNIEFLFSKNRLNVAISRAKCLSLVLASPNLLTVSCRTPEQMALVNTLCWVKSYSAD